MKKIILLLLPVLILIAAFSIKEKITITGNVKNASGDPLIATIKAGNNAAITQAGGNYKITVTEKEKYIVFSAPGYITCQTKIGKQRVINAIMKADASAMLDSSSRDMVLSTAGDAENEVNVQGYSSLKLEGKVSGVYALPRRSEDFLKSKNYNNQAGNTEEYSNIVENGFVKVKDEPISTFSIDVDAASYSNVRRYLNNNELPPAGAVRTEEMINYFKYQYPQPAGKDPFSINTEISDCPWSKENKLVLIGLQGRNIPVANLPPSNLVFLIDVSGSMMDENKLPLVKASMKLLTDQLRENDRISIVVYAGNAGLVLPSASGSEKMKIKTAIDALEAGGSTAGGAGIQLAYETAQKNFVKGNNRVILCTDGDFNVGLSSDDDMVRLIESERSKGIFLTVLGYGMGNYKDSKMQQLADKGNGNHAYIDGINEARKVLVNEFGGTLFTIAKDLKLQLEFNPAEVAGYRLIGYENRLLNKADFNDDKKDAGELGSGHTVTALYEIIPAGVQSGFLKDVDPLKYQKKKNEETTSFSDEMLTVKFRYKAPDKDNSELIIHPVVYKNVALNNTSDNFRFATSVAGFAMLLRNSEYKGNTTFSQVLSLANASLGNDTEGYRKEFISLVKKAEVIQNDKAIK